MKKLILLTWLALALPLSAAKYTEYPQTNTIFGNDLFLIANATTNYGVYFSDIPSPALKTNGIADVTVIDLAKSFAATNISADFAITSLTGVDGTNVQGATRVYTNTTELAKAITLPSSWIVKGDHTKYFDKQATLSVMVYPGFGTNAIFTDSSPQYSLTNMAGRPILAYYVASGGHFASSTWTNLTPWTDSKTWNLTNSTTPPTLVSGGVNGKDYISFDGVNDYLRRHGVTQLPQSEDMEIVAVLAYTNLNSAMQIVTMSSAASTPGISTFASIIRGNQSTSPSAQVDTISNMWMVVNFYANTNTITPTATFYTNGVSANRRSGGGGWDANAITVGATYNETLPANFGLAELAIFRTNLGAADAAGVKASGVRYRVITNMASRYGITIK